MKFDRFAMRAEEILGDVPAEFLEGVVGVEAHRRAEGHPHLEGVFTLGECGDDEVSRMTDPESLRSRIHLYHGSFAALARRDAAFDWEAELRETILHELRHHIEDRAGLPDLLEEDALDDLLHRWYAGEELRQGFYRAGEVQERNVWRLADDVFVEVSLRELGRVRDGPARLIVLEEHLEFEIPDGAGAGEILTFDGEGLERPGGGHGALHLVVVQ